MISFLLPTLIHVTVPGFEAAVEPYSQGAHSTQRDFT
jgi:hypothetical protein